MRSPHAAEPQKTAWLVKETWLQIGYPHLLSACREMPVEAASEMMAISFSPFMNEFFSAMLMSFFASCSIQDLISSPLVTVHSAAFEASE